MERVIPLSPDSGIETAHRCLEQLGCRQVASHETDGEMVTSWNLPDNRGEGELVFERQLQVGYFCLRLEEQGDDFEARWVEVCPPPEEREVAALLNSATVQERRQALRLVALGGFDALMPAVKQLCRDPDERVAHEATAVMDDYMGDAKDPLSMFTGSLHPEDRRQIVRWLIRDAADRHQPVNRTIEQLLRQALGDVDWEVRVSAMIACARFRASDLLREMAACQLNIPAARLPRKLDRELVHGIGQVALMQAQGVTPKGISEHNAKHRRWQHLYDRVAARSAALEDVIDHIVHYFSTPTEPAPLGQAEENRVALEPRDGSYFLPRTGVEMVWVPAGTYLLGDADARTTSLRRETHPGFFIARTALFESRDELKLLTWPEATETVERLKQDTGLDTLGIGTTTQWQMAARGTDGRPYPWGWGVEADWSVRSAPSGLAIFWSEPGEWALDGEIPVGVNRRGRRVADIRPDEEESPSGTKALRIVYNPR